MILIRIIIICLQVRLPMCDDNRVCIIYNENRETITSDHPEGRYASEAVTAVDRHTTNFEPDICIINNIIVRNLNNSLENTQIVSDSTYNGNYRSSSRTFLYKFHFIAQTMRVRTAYLRTVWSRGDRTMTSRPSVCVELKNGGIM